jgi:hypothetical protein
MGELNDCGGCMQYATTQRFESNFFWAKALNTIVYLKARNLHKDVNEMTSKEV